MKPDSPLIYLAGPYSANPNHYYPIHQLCLSELIRNRKAVFSPIIQCHEMAKTLSLPVNFEFWQDYNHLMLSHCNLLYVIETPGWEESKGTQSEIAFMKRLSRPRMLVTLKQGVLEVKMGKI